MKLEDHYSPARERRDDARFDGAYRGRRITWAEFYRLRPDLQPANDNDLREVA